MRKKRDLFASRPMQAAESLRKALSISEDGYLRTVGYNQHDARAYFLYGCLDEVFKVSTASMRWAEFVDAPEKDVRAYRASQDETQRHMYRVVVEAVLDEQEMWRRKLSEFLADLILFSATNEQDYYRLYLGYRFLEAYL